MQSLVIEKTLISISYGYRLREESLENQVYEVEENIMTPSNEEDPKREDRKS